jgi:tetratricopeptide (TPR) repeat protein
MPRRGHAVIASLAGIALAGLIAGTPVTAVELTVLPEGSAAQLTTLGNMELGQGRYETAIGHYRSALLVDKSYFWATYNLGLAYQQLGQYDDAATWYKKALAQSPDHPEVLCNLGWLAWQAKKFQEAADRFQDAARLSAENPVDAAQYWTNTGSAREGLQQWEAAGRAYQEALALDGANYAAAYNLGTLLIGHLNQQAGAAERAQALLQQAVEIAPERPAAWLNLAQARELTGKGDPRADYDRALEVATGPAAGERNEVRWQRARWFARTQPPQQIAMREELRQLLAADPDYPGANGMLGRYWFAIGDFEQAVASLEREVIAGHDDLTNPIDLESHYMLAVIYADHRPDPAKAIAHATAYYQQRPDSPKIHELRRRALRLSAATNPGEGEKGSDKPGEKTADKAAEKTTDKEVHGEAAHGEAAHAEPGHAEPAHPEPMHAEAPHAATAHEAPPHAAAAHGTEH